MDKKLENALDDLFGLVTCQDSFEEGQQCYDILEEALTTKSKKEQAFDIANKKCVDMYRLAVADNVASYNNWTEFDEYWLTEEEFNLLKEMSK